MLLYKVEEKKDLRSGDYSHMLNLIKEDYRNYYSASEYLKSRYDFCIQAIYSCLSEVNHMSNKKIAYEVLSKFLSDVKRINGIDYRIINNGSFYVRERPKVKAKRLRAS